MKLKTNTRIQLTTTAQSCVPNIGDFISVNPNSRGQILKLPPTHTAVQMVISA